MGLLAGVSTSGCLRLSEDEDQQQQNRLSEDEDQQQQNEENQTAPSADRTTTESDKLSLLFHDSTSQHEIGDQPGEYAATVYTAPTFEGGIIAGTDGTVARYTTAEDPLWQTETEHPLARTSVTGINTSTDLLAYVVDAGLGVYAFNMETGEQAWQTDSVLGTSPDQVRRGVIESIGDTLVGFFSDLADNTTIEGFNPETGDRLWVTRPAEYDDRYDHLVWGSSENTPLPNNRILFDMANRMGSIDESGDLHWEPKISERVGRISTPSVTDGDAVYLPNASVLIKYEPESDTSVWTYEAFDAITSSITIHDDLVIFGAEDNSVYALDRVTGEQVWRFQTNDYVRAGPIGVGQTVYIGSADSTVYAVGR
jgi:hypothetical protein